MNREWATQRRKEFLTAKNAKHTKPGAQRSDAAYRGKAAKAES
jgi:hypothetical protein